MFSPTLEFILTIAHREAGSRRHTHLTLEHLLYALAHDAEGEQILTAVGADLRQLRIDLDAYLSKSLEQFSRGRNREPEQTLAFRRVLQTAVLHVQSAGRDEVRAGDVLAAMLQEQKSYAAQLLAAQGVTRLDVLNYISHGIGKVPRAARRRRRRAAPRRQARRRGRRQQHRAQPARRVHDQPERARGRRQARSADRPHQGTAAHDSDPLPPPQEQPRVRRRARRGQDGDGRRARAAAARARGAGAPRRERRSSRSTRPPSSRARASAATSRSASRR